MFVFLHSNFFTRTLKMAIKKNGTINGTIKNGTINGH